MDLLVPVRVRVMANDGGASGVRVNDMMVRVMVMRAWVCQ